MLTNAKGRVLAVATAVVALGLGSHQALAGTQTGHASALILTQITVTEAQAMNFASILPPSAGGTVVLASSGTIAPVAGFSFYGAPAAGAFTAVGTANQPAVISFSGSNSLAGPGSATMTLNVSTPTPTTSFDGSGNLAFNVGGTLTVGSNQPAGAYSGTYTVTVDY